MMMPSFRSCAVLLSILLASLPHSGRAEEARKCQLAVVAKFPVIMEGTRASVPVSFNGQESRVWLDSGAFFSFMPKARAVELQLHTDPLPMEFTVRGVGGSFAPELATVQDFGIVGVTLHKVQFIVGGSDGGNGFLGANFLGIWDTEFDLAKGVVNLFKETGCNQMNLAYWGTGMSVGEARLLNGGQEHDHHIYVEVFVNGHSLRAMLDSGAPASTIGRRAAQRIGIDLAAPQVVASARISGVGSHQRQSWIVRNQLISIGGEDIRNSPIRVLDDSADFLDTEMVLGVDFLMAHHVIVSQPQRKMFLTYNGGPIFSASTEGEIGHLNTRAENMGASEQAPDPKTADEFAGRASGRLLRNDVPGAVADFTAAIRLAPARADLLGNRANAYLRGGQLDLASKDVDAALAVAPHDHRLLIERAHIRLGRGDKPGALADTDAAAAATPKASLDILAIVSLYEQMGLADRGVALLDPVIALHRDDAGYAALLNARSWNRALANADLDRALQDAEIAVRKSGSAPSVLDTRAMVRFRRKDFAGAIADETAALAARPDMSHALFLRGLARLATASGKSEIAGGQADLAKARAIQPDIDKFYALYGMIAPTATETKTAGLLPSSQ